MKLFKTLAVSAAVALASTSGVATAGTLEDVQARGELNCVVTTGVAGFAAPDDSGRWAGFDVDFCRATAAAVLGDGDKVKFIPTTGKTRFTVLNSGEGDLLYRNTTITMSRDADLKLTFLGVNYYDGQGFMVPKALGVTSAKELDGASICIQPGTTTELNLADYFRANKMSYEPVALETNEEGQVNYLAGRCDVYTTDASGLASTRGTFDNPNAHIILPEIISKEPLGPAVRQGDDQWEWQAQEKYSDEGQRRDQPVFGQQQGAPRHPQQGLDDDDYHRSLDPEPVDFIVQFFSGSEGEYLWIRSSAVCKPGKTGKQEQEKHS